MGEGRKQTKLRPSRRRRRRGGRPSRLEAGVAGAVVVAVAAAAIGAGVIKSRQSGEARARAAKAVAEGRALTPKAGSRQKLPQFSFPGLGGDRLASDDLQGKPAVINFFASWCPTCAEEMPDFEVVSKEFAGRSSLWGWPFKTPTRRLELSPPGPG